MISSAGLRCGAPLLLLVVGCGEASSNEAISPGTDGGGADAQHESGHGCPSGSVDCGNGCVNTNNDPENCGSCGRACAPSEQCHGGVCGAPCSDECSFHGEARCNGTGIQHCGEFDDTDICAEWGLIEPCPPGEVCDYATESCRQPCSDDCDPFSVILLPDTQYYTNKQPNDAKNTYSKQTRWIVEHQQSENIRFVIHLGDITNNNLPDQWEVADAAHAILDGAAIPYSVVPGNHDYLSGGDFDRDGSLMNDYFGPDRFAGRSWYGGAFRNSNTNNHASFEVGNLKFMVLSVEYAPRKEALCWAEDVIAAHPDRRVIIATHCFQTHGGDYSSSCPDPDYVAVGGSGSTVWEELASRHSNVFLVVAGHVGDSEYRIRNGNAGNQVHQMLVDYQFEASCSEADPNDCNNHCHHGNYTGNGWLRQLVFDPLNNIVHVKTFTVEDGNPSFFPDGIPVLFCSELYNPTTPGSGGQWYSQDPISSDHRYDFAYPMGTAITYVRDDAGKHAFDDHTVNSIGSGNQLAPRIAMAPAGSSVVVWEDDSSDADGDGRHDIRARGFEPGGCEGFSDIVVNSSEQGDQHSPSVGIDDQGNFVVVWADDSDDNGTYQIRGRGFAADGTERFPELTINSVAQGQQLAPVVAMAPDGRFVVGWEDDAAGNGDSQVMVRGFQADGTEGFADLSVHSDTMGQRIRPALALDATAGFVVAWQDDSDGNGTYQIHARGFDASGAERFARITVNSEAAGQQRNPAIGATAAGSFVVAWEDDQDNDGNHQILARGFDAAGTAVLPDFPVHTSAAGQHRWPSLSMSVDGAFAIAWQDDSDGNGTHQIRAHTFHAGGATWLDEWTANQIADGEQLLPAIALAKAGTVVTVWEDDMDGNGVFQILAAGRDGD